MSLDVFPPMKFHFHKELWKRLAPLLPRRTDLDQMQRSPGQDILAGLTVAAVALPLALAFGAASGLGATAGLVTAVIAGTLAAAFGGSNLQVSGPTGAMTVVLLPIAAQHGTSAVLVVGLLAGVFLIALALSGAGSLMRFVPLPVIEGFTLGIAVIIGLQQVPSALGAVAEGTTVLGTALAGVRSFLADPQWPAPAIALAVALAIIILIRKRPGLPVALLTVIVASLIVAFAGWPVATIGEIPRYLPSPAFPSVEWATLSTLIVPALAVASLAALESLLCASVADAMRIDEKHHPDRELFGQGVANLVVPMFGGVPATAAIARTAVNVRAGARSRLAAIVHALGLALVMLVAAPWVSQIPIPVLAGVLIATVIQMVDVGAVRAILRSTPGDAVVLLATCAATIMFDLSTAVVIGLSISALHALRQMSQTVVVETTDLALSTGSVEEQSLLRRHVVAYRFDGHLFFGAAHRFLLELSDASDIRVVILRMSRVRTLDATGAAILAETVRGLERRGITVLMSGLHPSQTDVAAALGVFDHLSSAAHVFADTPAAIEHANAHLRRDDVHDHDVPAHT